VAFCGVLWRFVAFCGVLWRFVAFCGFLAIWVVPGKLKFFVKSFGRDHLIVINGKPGNVDLLLVKPETPTIINSNIVNTKHKAH
jgi:hypothetical protein